MNVSVSIIIPTYNRVHLIKETLDSIIEQTYTNWECIIVDDGSTDDTIKVLKTYENKDSRFKIYRRPESMPKGANSCRNYGFEVSCGQYVNWFDSDDYMFPEFIEKKVAVLNSLNLDFVISKSVLFEDEDITNSKKPYNYTFNDFKISHYNFVSHKINWLTPDLMVNRKVLTEEVNFNEKLKTTAQEYNFFSKLTAITVNGIVIEDILTGYRQHDNSIESNLDSDKSRHSFELCLGYYYTMLDLSANIEKSVSAFLHESIIRRSLDVRLPLEVLRKMVTYLFRVNKEASIIFVVYQIFRRHFLRKYFLRKYKYQTSWE